MGITSPTSGTSPPLSAISLWPARNNFSFTFAADFTVVCMTFFGFAARIGIFLSAGLPRIAERGVLSTEEEAGRRIGPRLLDGSRFAVFGRRHLSALGRSSL